MRRNIIVMLVGIATIAVFTWLSAYLGQSTVNLVAAQALSTPTPVSTASSQSVNGSNAAIPGAVLNFLGVVLAALIAGGFAVYQVRRTRKLEQEKIAAQKEFELQRIRSEQEIVHLQDELAANRVLREQARQRKEVEEEQERRRKGENDKKMHRFKTIDGWAHAYREGLHADPRIARLHILDMNQSLEVASIYVRLQVHREARASFELDPHLIAAEKQRDPNELLRVGRMYLEGRMSAALDPVEAIHIYGLDPEKCGR